MFVGRLWTEWYPLVPIAVLSIFVLTASYLGDRRGSKLVWEISVGFNQKESLHLLVDQPHFQYWKIGKLPFCVVSLIVVLKKKTAEFNMSSLRI